MALLENIQILVSQIIVMFLLMAVGYVCFRLKYLDNKGASQMSLILTRIVAPCVIIHSFQRMFDPNLGIALLAAAGCTLLAMGLSGRQMLQVSYPWLDGGDVLLR